ncbi:M18 family aminopeptidase [Corynebacterium incognita]|uniref:M18 family aminopeptidase n=1 Tax=Corynebacterium incognita TaxID=2754725 RepID=A0A7G7CPP5_9CORY|nr:M18 family aminopeptidase [Corynebacterium incognita]QNE89561.1 M18 family aminopeptidase [Corynebacterium incognita]
MFASNDFLDFIQASPSSYHAAAEVARRLEASGFTNVDESAHWADGPGGYYFIRGGAVMAWWIPEEASPESGFRIVGSHTDSPGFVLKPSPNSSVAGWQRVAVEVYGGPILHSWFDRELVAAGQVVLTDGSTRLVNTGPVLRIPNLAIHLERSNEFKPDKQQHLMPVLTVGETTMTGVIAEQLGVNEADIAAFNMITADAQRGEVFGGEAEFIAAGRMDNLSSVYASLRALESAVASGDLGHDVAVLAAFDHEEVGSATRFGAAGPLLETVLQRIALSLGAGEEERFRMFARSSCVSADAAHSVHPNYAVKHDPDHHPIIGGGPVTKINANQRYASHAGTIALWENACRAAGVSVQRFVGHNEVPCGSTIGPITATRLGIDTVDVGVPMLSMHSAREMVGLADQAAFEQALFSYFLA